MFSFNWTVPPDGDHEIVAVAVDNRGATAVSDPVTIHVNRPPTVQMIAPESRASFTLLSSVQLVARSDDSDGSISAVEFMVDGLSIGSGARISGTNEFALLWTARDVGERVIKARARDNNGATAVSDSIGINVIGEASSAMRLLPAQYQGGRKFRVGIVVMPGRGTLSYSVAERPPAGWSASDISDGGTYDSAVGEVKFGPIPGDRVKLLTYSLKPPNNAKGIQIFSGELVADGVSSRIGGQQTIGGPRVKGRYLGRFSSR
jgi:chitinase